MPADRWERWTSNFGDRHGGSVLEVRGGALAGRGEDGSTFEARLPFAASYDGPPEAAACADAARAAVPADWGLLIVRKGGFAVARLSGARMVESKVGRRHVQGRTKAGGQSQQRFARRRANQARVAYEAAADHAARLLAGLDGPLVGGGDRSGLGETLGDPRLRGLTLLHEVLDVPEPRRDTLERAVLDACALRVDVVNVPPVVE